MRESYRVMRCRQRAIAARCVARFGLDTPICSSHEYLHAMLIRALLRDLETRISAARGCSFDVSPCGQAEYVARVGAVLNGFHFSEESIRIPAPLVCIARPVGEMALAGDIRVLQRIRPGAELTAA